MVLERRGRQTSLTAKQLLMQMWHRAAKMYTIPVLQCRSADVLVRLILSQHAHMVRTRTILPLIYMLSHVAHNGHRP
jgi:hypothetical protein